MIRLSSCCMLGSRLEVAHALSLGPAEGPAIPLADACASDGAAIEPRVAAAAGAADVMGERC
eukprot:4948814-Pyramimonas_sp.AAC.1